MANLQARHRKEIDIHQLEYESRCWRRSLMFMMEENVHLKNRLSEILSGPVDKKTLELAEDFQNRFVKGDEFIRLLRDDIVRLEKSAAASISKGQINPVVIGGKIKKIRGNISRVENLMAKIKFQFNEQLTKILQYEAG